MGLDNLCGKLLLRSWEQFWEASSSEQLYGRRSTVSLGKLSGPGKYSAYDSSLVKSLKSNPNPQSQYWAITCLWQLSFEQTAAEGLDK